MSRQLPSLLAALERQATTHPTERALVDDREEITWAEFAHRVRQCAAALEALALKPGERIGIHGLNSIELAVTLLACWRAGLVTVLLSPASKGPELAQELSATGAVAYLGDGDLYPVGELVLGRCPTMRLGLLLKRGASRPEVVARFTSEGRAVTGMPDSPPALAAIMFSSGTTGIPKGVMHTHASLAAMGVAWNDATAKSPQVILAVPPLVYTVTPLAQGLVNGWLSILLRRPDAGVLLEVVARHRCTLVMALTPVLAQLVLQAQQLQPRDTRTCRWWCVSGDAVPTGLSEHWSQHFPTPLRQGYGLTEILPVLGNWADHVQAGSLGLLWPHLEARVVTENDHLCAAGEIGELQLRGPALFAGYWNDPEATAAVIQDGWFRTGDLAHRDADGYFWFHGRLKLIITCDGEKISPQHVESALLEHPDVVEAGVVGMPDAQHGEVPVAFVRLQPGSTVDATVLRDFVAARVEDCGVPEEIYFAESLPRGRTGKVDRRALRERALKMATSKS
ncbi:MAG: acyl--CoA ligase [Verrucomicrobia bacterium]|nr:acyl--CoA ligase [Verrucomicrobiota bacterium]